MARFDPNDDGLNESQPAGSIPDFEDDDLVYEIFPDEFADPDKPRVRVLAGDELELAEDEVS